MNSKSKQPEKLEPELKHRLGRKRGPPPKLENRPDAGELLERLQDPKANLSRIAAELGTTDKTLRHFRDRHTPKIVREALARASRRPRPELQVSALERLEAIIDKVERLHEAIDRWLRDPKNPKQYNLDPRTHEVDIIFDQVIGERPNGTPITVRKSEKLSKLMSDLEEGLGITVVKGETKIADIRSLMVDAASALSPIVQAVGKIRGEIQPDPGQTVNILFASPDWQRIEENLMAALRPYPPALEAAAKVLEDPEK